MRQARLWVEILIIAVVAVAAFFAGRMLWPAAPGAGTGLNSSAGTDSLPAQSTTRQEVPPNTAVPGQAAQVAANIASPEIVIPAAPGVESKKRIFSIAIEGNQFKPSEVIVKAGDIANVTFHAMDAPYNIVQPDYGLSLSVPKGEKKLLEAQFTRPGKYLFYCSSCGGPEAGPKGYFTVVP